MTAGSLAPPSVETRAQPHGKLPFGFGPRFFVVLLIGLVWVVPAWWSPQFIAGLLLWDAFAIAAWVYDLKRLPRPAELTVSRSWKSPLSLARTSSVTVEIRTGAPVPVHAVVTDEIPSSLRVEPPVLRFTGPGVAQDYEVLPRERGDTRVGRLFVRYGTPIGFAERWAVAELSQTVRVLPDLVLAREHALYLIRSRQVEMERRRRKQRGLGREFESLREYRRGDELRDICWTATARRNQLITRAYEAEKSQALWIVVDSGRLLRAQVRDPHRPVQLTKLDYAVDAALALAQVASQSGDRVGLLAYGRSVQQSVGVGRGPQHIRTLVESLAQVRAEHTEANHARAARILLRTQSRRSLIVWITDFAETATTPDVIEYANEMARRHLVVFAAMSQPDLIALARSVPQTEDEMFRHAAALEIVQRRDLLLRGLRQSGVLAFELSPGTLATSLVNEYLAIKDRGML